MTAFLIAEAVVDIERAAVAGDNLILIVHLYDKFFAAVICGKVLRHSYRKRTIAITCIDYGKSLTIL